MTKKPTLHVLHFYIELIEGDLLLTGDLAEEACKLLADNSLSVIFSLYELNNLADDELPRTFSINSDTSVFLTSEHLGGS